MKKQVLSLLMAFFAVVALANNGNGKAESPKSTNYKEVISKVVYPTVCKEKGIEGKVIVTVKVSVDGDVIDHEFNTYPCSDLRDAVEDILPELKFTPAKNEKGDVVVGKVAVPVDFRLTI